MPTSKAELTFAMPYFKPPKRICRPTKLLIRENKLLREFIN